MNREQRRAQQRAQRRQGRHTKTRRSYADELGGMRLIRDLEPFTAQEVAALTLPPAMAYEAITKGLGQEDDFDTLAAVINVSMVRCETIGQQGVELCQQAQESLMHMRARHTRTGRWGVDAAARENIPAALDLHEQLLQLSGPRQMREALQEVLRRCESGLVHRVVGNTTAEQPARAKDTR
jgi:hypothetical protein